MASSLGYLAKQHKQAKRSRVPGIGYAALFRVFCGEGEVGMLSLPANDATLALLSRRLAEMPGWLWLSELAGVGSAERQAIDLGSRRERSRWISMASSKCCSRAPCSAASRQ